MESAGVEPGYRTGRARASSCPAAWDGGLAGQVPIAVLVQVAVLGALSELVAGTSASTSPDGTTNDGSRRPGNRAANEGASNGTTSATDAGATFFIALGGLAGHRAAGRTDGAANRCANRATDDTADDSSGYRPGSSADGLRAMLATAVVVVAVVVMVMVVADNAVVLDRRLVRRVGLKIAVSIIHCR